MKKLLFIFFSLAMYCTAYSQNNGAAASEENSRTPNESVSQIDVDATGNDRIISGQSDNAPGLTMSQLFSDDGSRHLLYGSTNSGYGTYGPLSSNTPFILGHTNLALGTDFFPNTYLYLDGPNTRIGLFTTTPSASLDVVGNTELNGTLTLIDGSQGAGKVLTSDAAGLATWADPASGSSYWSNANPNDLRLAEDSLNVVISYNAIGSSAKLHVNHSSTSGDHDAAFRVQVNGSTKMALQNNGGLDIGAFSALGNAPANGLYVAGDVVIGTATPAAGYELSVDGKIATEEVLIDLSGSWPDYVFASDYDLMSIDEFAQSIEENKHLPGIPSAAEVEEDGFLIGDMQTRTMEKVEELSLYIIQLHERITALEVENSKLKTRKSRRNK